MSEKTLAFKVRKINEHIEKLQSKIDRLKVERDKLQALRRKEWSPKWMS